MYGETSSAMRSSILEVTQRAAQREGIHEATRFLMMSATLDFWISVSSLTTWIMMELLRFPVFPTSEALNTRPANPHHVVWRWIWGSSGDLTSNEHIPLTSNSAAYPTKTQKWLFDENMDPAVLPWSDLLIASFVLFAEHGQPQAQQLAALTAGVRSIRDAVVSHLTSRNVVSAAEIEQLKLVEDLREDE
jgi:hypothetical protein